MFFSDIIALVEEKADGRSFGIEKHQRWANLVRSEASRSALATGFHGLYFLYKEADVIDGSIAGQARYALPDDYVSDLALWFDGVPMIKASPGVMDITTGSAESETPPTGSPTWYVPRGMEFELIPAPSLDGTRIAMFYNGTADTVSGLGFHDYFMEQWANLHVAGMAKFALDSLGANSQAKYFRDEFREELQRLMLDNRKFWLRGMKVRVMNWDEFSDKQRYLFPQFGTEFARTA
jgi:hypothetical protein